MMFAQMSNSRSLNWAPESSHPIIQSPISPLCCREKPMEVNIISSIDTNIEINREKCSYSIKGSRSCSKYCFNMTKFCLIHQPLKGERERCPLCHQLIRRERIRTSFPTAIVMAIVMATPDTTEDTTGMTTEMTETVKVTTTTELRDQVVEDQGMKRHLEVCSKKEKVKPSYYSKGINDPSRVILSSFSSPDLPPPPPPSIIDEMVSKEGNSNDICIDEWNLLEKVTTLYENFVLPMLGPRKILSEFDDDIQITPSTKHRYQEYLLYNLMVSHRLFSPTDPAVFLDMGSGKGSLSRTISSQMIHSSSLMLCIEQSTYKHKAEKNSHCFSYRTQYSLQDLNFDGLIDTALQEVGLRLPNESSTSVDSINVIGIGKHLCGNATDAALIALASLTTEISQNIKCLNGICIALCCHSNCQWKDTLSSLWLTSPSLPSHLHLSPQEWKLLKKWAGFFTLNSNEREIDRDREIIEKPLLEERAQLTSISDLSYHRRAEIGRMVKRLIDYGRVLYVRDVLGLEARLIYYVGEDVTPENTALIAWRKQ